MFENLTPDQMKQLGIVIFLATLPAIIWSIVIFKGRKSSKGPLFLAFFLGTLTVTPIMFLDYLWEIFPAFDIYAIINKNFTEVHIVALLTLLTVGIVEELVKSGVVRIIDKTKIGINTINDALKYSILAGLGFAFTENIFYFYFIWQASGIYGLLFPLVFRSVFTVCAHMIFSGIYGYYFGVAKFANPILEQKLWLGEKSRGSQFLSKLLGTDEAEAYKELTRLKGLGIVMTLHAAFNFFLEFAMLLPVIAIVFAGFLYLLYLMAHKAGAIAFTGLNRSSTIHKKDEDVVIELLGMWTKEGKYQDVIDICQRLLMRDPDNKVVQLFQAKAMDDAKLAKLEDSFSSLFRSEDEKRDDKSMRNLVRQKILMEMLREKGSTSSTPSTQAASPQRPVQQNGPSSQPSSPAPAAPAPSLPKPDIAPPEA